MDHGSRFWEEVGISLVLDESDCRLLARSLLLYEVIPDYATYKLSNFVWHGGIGTVSCSFYIVDLDMMSCIRSVHDHLILKARWQTLVGWATEIEELLDIAIRSMLDFSRVADCRLRPQRLCPLHSLFKWQIIVQNPSGEAEVLVRDKVALFPWSAILDHTE